MRLLKKLRKFYGKSEENRMEVFEIAGVLTAVIVLLGLFVIVLFWLCYK